MKEMIYQPMMANNELSFQRGSRTMSIANKQ